MSARVSRRFYLLGSMTAGLSLVRPATPFAAEPYPSGMIRIICANASGTPPDIVSRIIANELSESEGWRVIVENKPGAISTIGAAEVIKQPAQAA